MFQWFQCVPVLSAGWIVDGKWLVRYPSASVEFAWHSSGNCRFGDCVTPQGCIEAGIDTWLHKSGYVQQKTCSPLCSSTISGDIFFSSNILDQSHQLVPMKNSCISLCINVDPCLILLLHFMIQLHDHACPSRYNDAECLQSQSMQSVLLLAM